jgi:hypothetical protein
VLGAVRVDADRSPALVRLSEGLARRTSSGRFGYVCPAIVGSDQTPRAVALGASAALVATGAAVFVLDADGAVRAHPDEGASLGSVLALESDQRTAFLLRQREGMAELVAVELERATVLATLPAAFTSLAVEDDLLLVAGLSSEGRVQLRAFDASGTERDELGADVPAPEGAVAVFARLAAQQPYVVVLNGGGLRAELGRIEAGGYALVQRALGPAISGPVAVSADDVLVAFDGALHALRGEQAEAIETEAIVSCVGRVGALAYACAGGDLLRVQDGSPGERVFGLQDLDPPELSGLDAQTAELCSLQWLRFGIDLVAAGVALPGSDAGVLPRDRDTDAGSADAAGNAKRASAGCAVHAPASPPTSSAGLALLSMVCTLAAARLRRQPGMLASRAWPQRPMREQARVAARIA